MKFFAKRIVSKQLNALVHRTAFKPKSVRRLLFIHDIELGLTEAQFEQMCMLFSSEYDAIDRVHYSNNKKMLEGVPKPHLHPQSLDWRGRIVGEDLKFVLEKNYDIVIHFIDHISLPLQSFSAQLNAHFKIGPSTMDSQLNDLVLSPKNDFGSFFSDLKKYFIKINPNERI
ncbi:MAG: hypothetical protein P8H25_00075 [Flavobacteriaceae bacterium]|nr:hypothetical protein [Flavobacteriaceae bacterium]